MMGICKGKSMLYLEAAFVFLFTKGQRCSMATMVPVVYWYPGAVHTGIT